MNDKELADTCIICIKLLPSTFESLEYIHHTCLTVHFTKIRYMTSLSLNVLKKKNC